MIIKGAYLNFFYISLLTLGISSHSLTASDILVEESNGPGLSVPAGASSDGEGQFDDDEYYDEDEYEEYEEEYEDADTDLRDPLYYWNFGMFTVNDRLYFWVLKPIAQGYSKVLPERGRIGVKNFFVNLSMPVRLVNCLFQGKFNSAGTELAAFAINTTVGVIGFGTPAKNRFNLEYAFEDLGQTLGVHGIGNGFYLVMPLFGPSTLRDTLGFFGDSFLIPVNYLPFFWRLGVRSFQTVNETSLKIGDYEQLLQSAISPYDSLRNVYVQFRNSEIEK